MLIALFTGAAWFLALRLYYWLKPSLPDPLRLFFRRWWARRKRAAAAGQWPILESAGLPPKDWRGWPEQRKFALVLTHDVESQRGLDRVKQLATLEMELGFRSSFNFIPEGPYQVPDELRHWLVERGFEVGVHDHRHDGRLYKSQAHFLASASRINHFLREWDAVGFRSGFMFHNLEWIKALEVRYDASTFDTDPFEPQPDGVGTIFPFWVAGKDERGYVEMPYTLVQDSTLFIMLQEKSDEIWRQKYEWIMARGGMALLNVHPDYVAFDGETPKLGEFPADYYAGFLRWTKERNFGSCWHTLPRNVAEFCRPVSIKLLSLPILMHHSVVSPWAAA